MPRRLSYVRPLIIMLCPWSAYLAIQTLPFIACCLLRRCGLVWQWVATHWICSCLYLCTQDICINGCLIWANVSPFTCFLDLGDWNVDWRLTKVVSFNLKTWLYPWTWPCMCSQIFVQKVSGSYLLALIYIVCAHFAHKTPLFCDLGHLVTPDLLIIIFEAWQIYACLLKWYRLLINSLDCLAFLDVLMLTPFLDVLTPLSPYCYAWAFFCFLPQDYLACFLHNNPNACL